MCVHAPAGLPFCIPPLVVGLVEIGLQGFWQHKPVLSNCVPSDPLPPPSNLACGQTTRREVVTKKKVERKSF